MRRLHFGLTVTLFFALVGLIGCGDGLKRVPVEGKITAQKKPLAGATVQFLPTGSTKGEGGMGRSDNDGNFTLIGSRKGDKGVVPGEYKVRVSRLIDRTGSPLPPDARDAEVPGAHESIPPPYGSPEGSPLKVTVPEAGGKVEIEIPAKVLTK